MERWDEAGREEIENPDAEHVLVLWRMDRTKRVQVWRGLGLFVEVEELELGGEPAWKGGIECPMDKEELFMLLPEGEGVLAGLQNLFLCWCARLVDDDFLRALVSAGCGKNLTSLTLLSECLSSCCHLMLMWKWEWERERE